MRRPGSASVLRCHNRRSAAGMGDLMRRYRLLELPLPPGLTTLRCYAARLGYSPRYIRDNWRQREGFPEPVGELSPQGRLGRRSGGLGELVYEEKALDAFRARHTDLWGRRRMERVSTSRDLDERITPGEFARQLAGAGAEVIARYQDLDGFPETGADGTARLGDLVAYWNTRPIVLPAGYSGDEQVTIGEAGRILDIDPKTIAQHDGKPGFPAVVSGASAGRRSTGKPRRAPRKYRLGSIVQFLNTGLPGKRGPSASAVA
jgi:hypothetical protein